MGQTGDDSSDSGPKILTPAQAAVQAVCEAFGWPEALKAGHAASWAKRTRTKLGMELAPFVEAFSRHYGRRDPGAGEWWVYREVYPCKGQGELPTPTIVVNSWGRWDLPVAVQLPGRREPAGFDSLRQYLERRQDAQ